MSKTLVKTSEFVLSVRRKSRRKDL